MLQALRAPWPSQCEVCRRWNAARLCAACVQRFAPPTLRCARCALRVGLETLACGECLRDPPPYTTTVCAADYGFPWDGLIAAFKFNQQVELAAPLAQRITAAVRARGEAPTAQLVLPVPLSAARLAERGYNQAWELARRVASACGLPARPDVLLRALDTAHQADLTRAERQRNLRAAFFVDVRWRGVLTGRCVALVDDVLTTGATARGCAAALLRGGAAEVHVWVVARTPGR
jgi:ComF family protein